MQIDWVTVAAQLINFLILVALLQRFLYKPVRNAMLERAAALQQQRLDADQARKEIVEQKAEIVAERNAIKDAKTALTEKVNVEVKVLRQQLEQKARAETDELKAQWIAQLKDEQEEFRIEFGKQVGRNFFKFSKLAFSQLADSSAEQKTIDRFCEHLEALKEIDRVQFRKSAERAAATIKIATVFKLSAAEKKTLASAVDQFVGAPCEPVFEQDASLLMGVRLSVSGKTIEWSLRGYLDEFAKIPVLPARSGKTVRQVKRQKKAAG